MHRLSDKNLKDKTAVCSICGPVKLIRINQGGSCPTGHSETNVRKYKTKNGFRRLRGRDRIELLKNYGERCMICSKEVLESPHLDHCHETGEWRGVLCRECNIGLGMFEDDIERLASAASYLKQHGFTPQEKKVR